MKFTSAGPDPRNSARSTDAVPTGAMIKVIARKIKIQRCWGQACKLEQRDYLWQNLSMCVNARGTSAYTYLQKYRVLEEETMIRLISAAGLTLAISASAHALTFVPVHQPKSLVTQVRHACGAGMHMVNGVCRTTVMRRQARRCMVWGAGQVCRKWG